ncbi:MAG: hypothetical protein U1E51_00320 [Candidatus Binatia bacterium]|nr:hypothetical protein [Candidatus Binatia bacterium]
MLLRTLKEGIPIGVEVAPVVTARVGQGQLGFEIGKDLPTHVIDVPNEDPGPHGVATQAFDQVSEQSRQSRVQSQNQDALGGVFFRKPVGSMHQDTRFAGARHATKERDSINVHFGYGALVGVQKQHPIVEGCAAYRTAELIIVQVAKVYDHVGIHSVCERVRHRRWLFIDGYGLAPHLAKMRLSALDPTRAQFQQNVTSNLLTAAVHDLRDCGHQLVVAGEDR